MGLASSRKEARQLVRHAHFTLNGKKADIPSIILKVGDVVALKDKSRSSEKIKGLMENMANTQYFKVNNSAEITVKDILEAVYIALTEKGYNPVSQIVGYIMSGDPTYVTSYKNARYLIMKVERDELLEELLKSYIDVNLK